MNPEARKLFDIAEALLAEAVRQDPVTMPRSSAHTAYYVMFHAARAVLLDAHGTVSTKHGSVLDGFGALVRNEAPETRRWAKELRSAYNARLQGDYLGKALAPDDAAELIALAVGFVAWCARRLGVEVPPTAGP
jgi:uncharacterized protein (UPF0332 family)